MLWWRKSSAFRICPRRRRIGFGGRDAALRFTYVSDPEQRSVGDLLGQAWDEVFLAHAGVADAGCAAEIAHGVESAFSRLGLHLTPPEGAPCILRCSGKPMFDGEQRLRGYRGTGRRTSPIRCRPR